MGGPDITRGLNSTAAGLAESSGPDVVTHEASKPICVFGDGSYAFRTPKQVVYVDTEGRANTIFHHQDLADNMGRFGEEKAKVFALSEANISPSPSFKHEEPQTKPNDAVIEIEINHLSVESIVGKVAVEHSRTTDLEKPLVVHLEHRFDGDMREIAKEAAEFLGTAVRIYEAGGVDYVDAHAQKSDT